MTTKLNRRGFLGALSAIATGGPALVDALHGSLNNAHLFHYYNGAEMVAVPPGGILDGLLRLAVDTYLIARLPGSGDNYDMEWAVSELRRIFQIKDMDTRAVMHLADRFIADYEAEIDDITSRVMNYQPTGEYTCHGAWVVTSGGKM